MSIPLRHSDPSRVIASARTFFVTSSIAEKRKLLQSHRSGGLFIRVLFDYRAQRKFQLHEFVVMPDHFHLLITVDSGMTIERAVQFINGGFAFQAGREQGIGSPVWQKGFSEVRVLDAEAYCGIAEYIRNNPVRRGLISGASDFPHSSAYAGFELDSVPQGLKPFKSYVADGVAKSHALIRTDGAPRSYPDTNLQRTLVRRFPFRLQGCEEVGAAAGSEEFVVFDHGGGADAGRGQRVFDADDAGSEADANRVGECDVGREGESDFDFGAGFEGAVEIEENAAGAHVLGFSMNFAGFSGASFSGASLSGDAFVGTGLPGTGTFQPDNGRQAHVKAPHHPPFL